MIRVWIADDHHLFAEGLSQALNSIPDMRVQGMSHTGPDLLSSVSAATTDVLLVDLELPQASGLEVLRALDSPPPTIVVTMHADAEHQLEARMSGARGFFSKSTPLATLAAAVRAVHGGESLIELGNDDLTATLDRHRRPVLEPGAAALTEREKELLALLARGISATEDLADELYISQKTVKNHLANIFGKLGVNDRTQAAVEAIRLGLVDRK